ncbi:MAG: hypothetical protein HYV75_06420 [Opitutae bacterium]|nr:hypothetical protein [Opitutae bacterium]
MSAPPGCGLDAVNRVERRGVVSLGVAELVGVDRDAVLQYLGELRAMRREAAVAEADKRRGFLAEDEAGSLGEGLAVVVAGDAGQAVEVEDGGFFAGVDLGALGIGQERVLNIVIFLGFGLDAESGEFNVGCFIHSWCRQRRGLSQCQNGHCEAGDDRLRKELKRSHK